MSEGEEYPELLNLGFSVADAEYPEFRTSRTSLVVRFADWREQTVVLTFENCSGFHWEEVPPVDNRCCDDSSYDIRHSSWLKRHLALNPDASACGLKHYRLCFNECGTLDILASAIEVSND